MYQCADCYYVGELDRHGRCPRCHSDAVVAEAILTLKVSDPWGDICRNGPDCSHPFCPEHRPRPDWNPKWWPKMMTPEMAWESLLATS